MEDKTKMSNGLHRAVLIKRRERWPAVVIPEMKGRMSVLGMTDDNKLVVIQSINCPYDMRAI